MYFLILDIYFVNKIQLSQPNPTVITKITGIFSNSFFLEFCPCLTFFVRFYDRPIIFSINRINDILRIFPIKYMVYIYFFR